MSHFFLSLSVSFGDLSVQTHNQSLSLKDDLTKVGEFRQKPDLDLPSVFLKIPCLFISSTVVGLGFLVLFILLFTFFFLFFP